MRYAHAFSYWNNTLYTGSTKIKPKIKFNKEKNTIYTNIDMNYVTNPWIVWNIQNRLPQHKISIGNAKENKLK